MKKIFLLSLFMVVFGGTCSAQQVLTIDQCREMALQHNRDKQSAQLTSQQAGYTLKSTKALFFPDFSIMAFGLYDTGKGNFGMDLTNLKTNMTTIVMDAASKKVINELQATYLGAIKNQIPDDVNLLDYKIGWVGSVGLLMKQPLYMGGKIRAGYAMAKTAVKLAEQNERLTDAQVIQQANEAYANCVKAKELKVVAEKYKALLEELEKNVQSAIKHGLKLKNDEMKVQVKLNEVELQIRRAENAQRLAAMNLNHVIGQPLSTQFDVSSEYPAVDDASTLQNGDVLQRPEYAMLDYKAQMAAQEVKIAKSAMLPQVALLAKYGYTGGVKVNDELLMNSANFAGGVTVTVPIYHFGERTNKVKAAKIKQQQAELDRDNKAEMMQLELTQCANNLDESRLEVDLSQRSLDQAEENMKLSKQQYDAGTETLSDYLESQALWQQAYQIKIDAHFQLYLNSVAYLKAAGRLVP